MTIAPFLNKLNSLILNPIIILLFVVSTVYFLVGIIRFINVDPADKSSARKEARDAIMWGIVGMAVMFSVYGLISFVLKTFMIPAGSNTSYINGKL